jgi:uncharacterized membrane protein
MVAVAGWLGTTMLGAVVGAAAGGAAGGLMGRLREHGIDDAEAERYAEGVRSGCTLVTARVADERAAEVSSILERNQTVDLGLRAERDGEELWR